MRQSIPHYLSRKKTCVYVRMYILTMSSSLFFSAARRDSSRRLASPSPSALFVSVASRALSSSSRSLAWLASRERASLPCFSSSRDS